MPLPLPNDASRRLVEALGLGDRNVVSITLRLAVGDNVTAEVVEYVRDAALNEFVDVVEECDIVVGRRWVSVDERLPEKGVPVIGWFPSATQPFECKLNQHDGAWCDSDTGIHLLEHSRPTHWMPTPPAPPESK